MMRQDTPTRPARQDGHEAVTVKFADGRLHRSHRDAARTGNFAHRTGAVDQIHHGKHAVVRLGLAVRVEVNAESRAEDLALVAVHRNDVVLESLHQMEDDVDGRGETFFGEESRNVEARVVLGIRPIRGVRAVHLREG